MKKMVWVMLFLWLVVAAGDLKGQSQVTVKVIDNDTEEPLVGATVQLAGTTQGVVTDVNGEAQLVFSPGTPLEIVVSYVGYNSLRRKIQSGIDSLVVQLEPEEALEEVIVTATRSSRTIDDIPIRMEVISGEELDEKAAMNSTNIAMLLRESSGIQVQQTSANSANQTLRIQGLDGRYTQLLRDGFPLYGGFSGGLSIMQIPPLDLRQVEVVKGSVSTLYGGGAIAGIVNLVTKEPGEEPERLLMANQTTAGGTTLNTFLSGRGQRKGYTIYASANRQEPYDPNEDGFSDIPRVRSIAFNPKVYFYPSARATLSVGLTSSYEYREGGDLRVIDDQRDIDHSFSEANYSGRLGSQIRYDQKLASGATITARNSINLFARNIDSPAYGFYGEQLATFSEIALNGKRDAHEVVAGVNLFTDQFAAPNDTFIPGIGEVDRSYSLLTLGAFAQDTWEVSDKNTLEAGLRSDYNTNYGFFLLPRLSWMYRPWSSFTIRLGGGRGYKLPTIFLEDAERFAFNRVLPYGKNGQRPVEESSWGANADFNYKMAFGQNWTLAVNQLLFLTELRQPVFLSQEALGDNTNFYLSNRDSPTTSRGIETNLKLGYLNWKTFFQYAYTSTQLNEGSGYWQKSLTPRHSAGFVLMYEKHEAFRIGYEVYYTGHQYRSDRSVTPDFWIMGIMAMKEWKRVSLFLNFENFTDTRLSKYQDTVYPPYNNPSFAEVWAPADGFVANGGFILRL